LGNVSGQLAPFYDQSILRALAKDARAATFINFIYLNYNYKILINIEISRT